MSVMFLKNNSVSSFASFSSGILAKTLYTLSLYLTVIPSSDKAKSTALYLPVRRSAAKFLKRRQVSPDTVIAKRNPRENYFRRKKTWFVCMTLFLNWKTGWNLCAYNRKKLRAIWNFMKKNAILKLVFAQYTGAFR